MRDPAKEHFEETAGTRLHRSRDAPVFNAVMLSESTAATASSLEPPCQALSPFPSELDGIAEVPSPSSRATCDSFGPSASTGEGQRPRRRPPRRTLPWSLLLTSVCQALFFRHPSPCDAFAGLAHPPSSLVYPQTRRQPRSKDSLLLLHSERADAGGGDAGGSLGVVDVGTDDNPFDSSFEIPMPTPNGGFTHTSLSKAKISAANKGKEPWNKGQSRSEEVKAKIAAGVRAANRLRFLQKLESLNVTEEEWERQRAEEQRRKLMEQQSRRTAKGGYRPTPETKEKISRILKEKYANGEVKRREISPDRVRRGFSHSPETRAKISASLRQRWATDEDYRSNMVQKALSASNSTEVRQKISQSLKLKWRDPEFRQAMLQKMASKRQYSVGSVKHDASHRQRISEAMKAKWQDEAYRQKTLESIAKRREAMMSRHPKVPASGRTEKSHRNRSPSTIALLREGGSSSKSALLRTNEIDPKANGVAVARPMEPLKQPKKGRQSRQGSASVATPVAAATPRTVASRASPGKSDSPESTSSSSAKEFGAQFAPNGSEKDSSGVVHVRSDIDDCDSKKKTPKRRASQPLARHKHGSVDLLKEERRDLYDLLYGDDDELDDDEREHVGRPVALPRKGTSAFPKAASLSITKSALSATGLTLDDDESLEHFDPYGLDDFHSSSSEASFDA